ncbi:DUF5667 domain-containing protein [Aeromicrobium sp. Sec7.5]|uniref:DUF5667 domain-containing protein n=1 Tax=Aeromicrobium sp. Sec7.5 TaxID=3121276 RepID=UPI002FE492BD
MTSHKREADAFEAALRGAPADAAVTELVRHAEILCARAATVAPSDDFRLALRERLMAEAPELLTAHPRPAATAVAAPRTSGLRRRVARLSAAALVAVGGVGIVASSAQAVPGDMLYGVKRSVESVELALHRTDEARGTFQLEQARERLAEAEHLADEGDLERSATALADFRNQADAGTADLFTDYEAEGQSASVESVNDFAVESAGTLTDLAEQFPSTSTSTSSDPVELAMNTVRDIATQASALCLECGPITLPELQAIASPTDGTTTSAAPSAGPAPTPTKSSPSATGAPAPTPSKTPLLTQPTTPAPSSTPSPAPQVPIVTPLVDSLLGEEGLVPSLLGGLLGQK